MVTGLIGFLPLGLTRENPFYLSFLTFFHFFLFAIGKKFRFKRENEFL